MMAGKDGKRQLLPELEPLLSLQLPESWTRRLLSAGGEVWGVGFFYGESDRVSVDINCWDDAPRFQTWVYGSTDKRYGTLEEAIKRVQYLMPIVARGVHWSDIASVRNEEYWSSLIDRDGIGQATITLLLDRFGSLKSLREASLEDIEAIKGIGEDKAWLIAGHLHLNVRYHELWDPDKEKWVDLYRVPKEVIDQCVLTATHLSQSVRKDLAARGIDLKDA